MKDRFYRFDPNLKYLNISTLRGMITTKKLYRLEQAVVAFEGDKALALVIPYQQLERISRQIAFLDILDALSYEPRINEILTALEELQAPEKMSLADIRKWWNQRKANIPLSSERPNV